MRRSDSSDSPLDTERDRDHFCVDPFLGSSAGDYGSFLTYHWTIGPLHLTTYDTDPLLRKGCEQLPATHVEPVQVVDPLPLTGPFLGITCALFLR